jgi:hypothetical protein
MVTMIFFFLSLLFTALVDKIRRLVPAGPTPLTSKMDVLSRTHSGQPRVTG